MPQSKIVIYGGTWCSDCRRAKRFFDNHKIQYEWVDLDNDKEALGYVLKVNNGKRVIPTIVFEDGSVLVEPTDAELSEKLSITR